MIDSVEKEKKILRYKQARGTEQGIDGKETLRNNYGPTFKVIIIKDSCHYNWIKERTSNK